MILGIIPTNATSHEALPWGLKSKLASPIWPLVALTTTYVVILEDKERNKPAMISAFPKIIMNGPAASGLCPISRYVAAGLLITPHIRSLVPMNFTSGDSGLFRIGSIRSSVSSAIVSLQTGHIVASAGTGLSQNSQRRTVHHLIRGDTQNRMSRLSI